MQFVSHRGYWHKTIEHNTSVAFSRALEMGFGVETDIRDCLGNLVISHDMPIGDEMNLSTFLSLYNQYKPHNILALNIKSDGLAQKLKEYLIQYGLSNYFVFDMSIPDTRFYLKENINTFVRQSDIETIPFLYDEATGLWIDCFFQDFMDHESMKMYLSDEKKICLVSPELHGRKHELFWTFLKESNLYEDKNIYLCTDYPEDARNFFESSIR